MPVVAVDKVRIPFVHRARLSLRGQTRQAFLLDLGLEGVFVETTESLAVGAALKLGFALPGNAIPIEARGRVAWVRGEGAAGAGLPAGAGVQFVEMSEADEARLREFLEEYCRRDGRARRFARPWPAAQAVGGKR